MGMKRLVLAVSGASMLMTLLVPWAFPQAPVREITQIAGEVYRIRNQNHYSVFAVTSAGIIATDPINAAAAQWLKAEWQRRFNSTLAIQESILYRPGKSGQALS